jgi:hypothetical protein
VEEVWLMCLSVHVMLLWQHNLWGYLVLAWLLSANSSALVGMVLNAVVPGYVCCSTSSSS